MIRNLVEGFKLELWKQLLLVLVEKVASDAEVKLDLVQLVLR